MSSLCKSAQTCAGLTMPSHLLRTSNLQQIAYRMNSLCKSPQTCISLTMHSHLLRTSNLQQSMHLLGYKEITANKHYPHLISESFSGRIKEQLCNPSLRQMKIHYPLAVHNLLKMTLMRSYLLVPMNRCNFGTF